MVTSMIPSIMTYEFSIKDDNLAWVRENGYQVFLSCFHPEAGLLLRQGGGPG